MSEISQFSVENVNTFFPQNGGISLQINGSKPKDFHEKKGFIRLEGKDFWKVLGVVLGRENYERFESLHPFSFSSPLVEFEEYKSGSERFSIRLNVFAKEAEATQSNVLKNLELFVKNGNPIVSVSFYSIRKKKEDLLFKILISASQIILSQCNDVNLLTLPVDLEYIVEEEEEDIDHISLEDERRETLMRVMDKKFGNKEEEKAAQEREKERQKEKKIGSRLKKLVKSKSKGSSSLSNPSTPLLQSSSSLSSSPSLKSSSSQVLDLIESDCEKIIEEEIPIEQPTVVEEKHPDLRRIEGLVKCSSDFDWKKSPQNEQKKSSKEESPPSSPVSAAAPIASAPKSVDQRIPKVNISPPVVPVMEKKLENTPLISSEKKSTSIFSIACCGKR